MATRTTIQPGDGDPRHGTTNGYSNLRCGRQPDGPRKTCQPCKDAHAAWQLKYMYAHEEQQRKQSERAKARRAARKRYYGTPYEQL